MPIILFSDNASTILAAPITLGAGSLTVTSGTGSMFPNPGADQYFPLTLTDAATNSFYEIVQVTARSADTFTIIRGQEGTTPRAWLSGDVAANYWTAGSAQAMVQVAQMQVQATNYGADVGSTNALVINLSPAPVSLASMRGSPIRVAVANTNTGAATLNVNSFGAVVIVDRGNALSAGALTAGHVVEVAYNGTSFDLIGGSGTGRLINIQTFTTSGTYTPTPGTNSIVVTVQGGGGAGSGVAATGTNQVSIGSGGSAGAMGKGRYTSGFAGAVVTIGAGGTPGAAGATGTAGGTSSFGALLTAPGGIAGTQAGPSVPPFFSTGTSFSGPSSGGNIINTAGAGALPAQAPSTTSVIGSPGSASFFGAGGSVPGVGSNGIAAPTRGAGGSGTAQTVSAGALTGGAGAGGIIVVEEYA